MGKRATYEELEQRVEALKKERLKRKRLEKALKGTESKLRDLSETSEHRFRSLFNFYPQPIALTELETGRVIDVNDMFCDVSQFTREEVIGRTSVELGSWSTKERKGFLERLRKSGEIQAAEDDCPMKDGSLRHALRFSKIVELDGKTSIINIFVDITERKRAEDALQEREERLRFSLEGSGDGAWEWDLGTSKLNLSERTKEMWGFDQNRRDFERSDFVDLVHPDYIEYLDNMMKDVREGKTEIYRVEYMAKTKDGDWRWMLSRGKVIAWTKDGRPQKVFGTQSDVTERKRAEEALLESKKKLTKRNLELEELNTALKVLLRKREEHKVELEETVLLNTRHQIVPYLEKLRKKGLDKEGADYVNSIESNLKRLVSPSLQKLSPEFLNLTPTELQVVSLIKEGKTTKAIGDLMSLSSRTVEFHRNNIRKKLGLKKKSANLRTHLLSIQ